MGMLRVDGTWCCQKLYLYIYIFFRFMSRTCDSLEYSASTGDSHTVALAHAVALLLSGHVVSLAAPPRTVALKVFEAATAGPRLL